MYSGRVWDGRSSSASSSLFGLDGDAERPFSRSKPPVRTLPATRVAGKRRRRRRLSRALRSMSLVLALLGLSRWARVMRALTRGLVLVAALCFYALPDKASAAGSVGTFRPKTAPPTTAPPTSTPGVYSESLSHLIDTADLLVVLVTGSLIVGTFVLMRRGGDRAV